MSRVTPWVAAAVAGPVLLAGALAAVDGSPPVTAEPPAAAMLGAVAPAVAPAPRPPEGVLARRTVAVPGAAGDRVELGVHAYEVRGRTAVLQVTVTPRFASAERGARVTLRDAVGGASLRPSVDDGEARRDVLALGAFRWESPAGTAGRNGAPIEAWYVFPAPPAATTAVDVRFAGGLPAFPAVPVAR